MKAWKTGKNWSDRFIPEIKQHVAAILSMDAFMIMEGSQIEDARHNSDLMVLDIANTRIACRIRKAKYAADYSKDITIRAQLPYGGATELDKILSGWGDYFFYGFADDDEIHLQKWLFGRIRAIGPYIKKLYDENAVPKFIKNFDNSSMFMPLEWAKIPDFIIAKAGYDEVGQDGSPAGT
jgi:hypothetical protein